jgi:GNAT superfamily N-acetyltransferase
VSGDPLAEYPKTIVLRDGAHLVLRRPTPADDRAVARLLAAAAAEAGAPETADAVVVAADGERTAGVALLAKDGDAARVAVALDPAYRGRRLGTWMLLDAVHLASALGVARREAEVRADDADRLAALGRLDFVVDATRSSPGRLVLVKRLHAGWPDF